MPGLMIFDSLAAAIRVRFELLDRTETGYIVRKRTRAGFALGLVEVRRT